MPSTCEVTATMRKHMTTISIVKTRSRTRFTQKSQSMACAGGRKATSNGVRSATTTRAITSVKSHFDMCFEVLESIMYHAGSWLESSATLRPRDLSSCIVWTMLSSLFDLLNMPPNAWPDPEALTLLAAETFVSDCAAWPWETMARTRPARRNERQIDSKIGLNSSPCGRIGRRSKREARHVQTYQGECETSGPFFNSRVFELRHTRF